MSQPTLAEKELCIYVNGADRSMAEVFSDDPIWTARLDKWYAPYKVIDQAKWYRIPTNEIVRVSLLRRGRKDGADDETHQEGEYITQNRADCTLLGVPNGNPDSFHGSGVWA